MISLAHHRRVLTLLAFIATAAAAGYLVTCAIFPSPLLPKSVLVPAFRGVPAEAAVADLLRLGLRAKLADTVADPLVSAGMVAWQSPAPETALPEGAVVRLGVSSGAPLVSMPDVTDLDLGTARLVIEAAGLKIGRIDTTRNDLDLGTVIVTAPSAGTTLHPGEFIRLGVSSGPPSVRVPELIGLTVSAARDRLAAAGLRVGLLEQRLEGKAGTVLAQHPASGEMVTKESGVNLTISGTLP